MISGHSCEGLGGRRIDRTLVWVYPLTNDREERAKMQLVKSTESKSIQGAEGSSDERVHLQKPPALLACSPVSPPQQRQTGITTPGRTPGAGTAEIGRHVDL